MSKKTRVLIVDDNESLCRSMALILTRKGYAVVTAQDGFQAIKEVEQRPFDVIFMDIKMPAMDGVQTYKAIKQIRSETVVIMMTAYAVEDLIQDALKEGVFAVIHKPLDFDRIFTLIDQALDDELGALILLVDDDGTAKALGNILTRKRYQVGRAATGEEAVTMAEAREYDIMLIDMKLPAMNGLETYLTIHERHPRAVAIIMTDYRKGMSELINEALKRSAYICLDKPIDIELLLSLLEEISGKIDKMKRI